MSLPHSLVGDALAKVSAAGAIAGGIRSIAWLEFELASGLKVEVVPTASTVDSVELLGLRVDVVASFRELAKWPGGPLEVKNEISAFASAIGRPIDAASLELSPGAVIADSLLMGFRGGPTVRIDHDQGLPMSLCLSLLPQVPSNKSLERSQ